MEKGRKKCPLSFGRERGSKWRNFIVLKTKQNQRIYNYRPPPNKQTVKQTTNPLKYLDFAVLTEEGTSNRDLIQHSTPEK